MRQTFHESAMSQGPTRSQGACKELREPAMFRVSKYQGGSNESESQQWAREPTRSQEPAISQATCELAMSQGANKEPGSQQEPAMNQAPSEPAIEQGRQQWVRVGNVPGTGNELGSQQEAREPRESAMSQGVIKVPQRQ